MWWILSPTQSYIDLELMDKELFSSRIIGIKFITFSFSILDDTILHFLLKEVWFTLTTIKTF